MDLPVMLPEQLGAYLKAIRLSQGLTQVQLAQRLGLSQTRIVEIEKAPGRIRVDQFLQVLHAMQTRLVLQDPRPKPASQRLAPEDFTSSAVTESAARYNPPPSYTANEGEW